MEPLNEKKQEFLKAYDELSDALFQHCYYRVSNREIAKDLIQEAFVKTWEYIVSDKEIKNLKAFLYRVTNNLIIDYYRKKKEISLDNLREDGFDVSADDEERVRAGAEVERSLHLLNKLEDKYKEIIILRFVDGLSPTEIGEITGQTENAVSVSTNRALKKFRELLE
jgi:RNA polymerase sigma-70 factor, ECF subfamily